MSELPNPLQGRENTTQQVGYLRYDYCLDNKALLVGILPRGALILDIIVKVLAPFGSILSGGCAEILII
ncbi:hypothetical protein [Bartonella sp. DGB2]|uniref:hypothetical protein n=1 Tax=Bartonella sp. DGB2 TaxID=3388426 RepID=UPI00398FEC9B